MNSDWDDQRLGEPDYPPLIARRRYQPEPLISNREILRATAVYILTILGVVGLSYLVFAK